MIFINYYIIYCIGNVIIFVSKIFINIFLILLLLFNYENKSRIILIVAWNNWLIIFILYLIFYRNNFSFIFIKKQFIIYYIKKQIYISKFSNTRIYMCLSK